MRWQDEFESATAERVGSWAPLSGGDIGSSYRLELASGTSCFLKHYPEACRGQTAAEAKGLAWLDEPGVIRIPPVLAVGDDWIALEWIDPGRPGRHSAALLGRQLARLHASEAPHFGLDHDNWIGRLPQNNQSKQDWPSFYVERRLSPLVAQARDADLLDASELRSFETLFRRMSELTGPSQSPARLHGDLWSGNLLFDVEGTPWLIDPAAYAGHREVDLAMMKLFGGFDSEVFKAYEQESPLDAGAHARVELYQLYPLLVHLLLFGGSYRDSVLAALSRALR